MSRSGISIPTFTRSREGTIRGKPHPSTTEVDSPSGGCGEGSKGKTMLPNIPVAAWQAPYSPQKRTAVQATSFTSEEARGGGDSWCFLGPVQNGGAAPLKPLRKFGAGE